MINITLLHYVTYLDRIISSFLQRNYYKLRVHIAHCLLLRQGEANNPQRSGAGGGFSLEEN